MNSGQLQALIFDIVADVTTDADLAGIHPGVSFDNQFEIDSVNYLNIMMTLEARLGLSIPEPEALVSEIFNRSWPRKSGKPRQTRLEPFSIPTGVSFGRARLLEGKRLHGMAARVRSRRCNFVEVFSCSSAMC